MWIKICGINDIESARRIAELKPAAIGLNFYRQTPRFVDPDIAAQIVRELPREIEPVGIFVNHTADEIIQLCAQCGLTTIQLHGDETPELLAKLKSKKIIRAFRVGPEGLHAVAVYLKRCSRLDAMPDACLIDARVEGQFGGTGQTAPWTMLAREYLTDDWPRLILSGGLSQDNVAEAIRQCRPWGVDVASGVESSPGVKNFDSVAKFISASRLTSAETAHNDPQL